MPLTEIYAATGRLLEVERTAPAEHPLQTKISQLFGVRS